MLHRWGEIVNWLQKTATGNGNLQPEIKTNKHIANVNMSSRSLMMPETFGTTLVRATRGPACFRFAYFGSRLSSCWYGKQSSVALILNDLLLKVGCLCALYTYKILKRNCVWWKNVVHSFEFWINIDLPGTPAGAASNAWIKTKCDHECSRRRSTNMLRSIGLVNSYLPAIN